eukprot:5552826-Pyramimonas_sp.AAC.1
MRGDRVAASSRTGVGKGSAPRHAAPPPPEAAGTGRGKRARAEGGNRTPSPPSVKARPCRYTDIRESAPS